MEEESKEINYNRNTFEQILSMHRTRTRRGRFRKIKVEVDGSIGCPTSTDRDTVYMASEEAIGVKSGAFSSSLIGIIHEGNETTSAAIIKSPLRGVEEVSRENCTYSLVLEEESKEINYNRNTFEQIPSMRRPRMRRARFKKIRTAAPGRNHPHPPHSSSPSKFLFNNMHSNPGLPLPSAPPWLIFVTTWDSEDALLKCLGKELISLSYLSICLSALEYLIICLTVIFSFLCRIRIVIV